MQWRVARFADPGKRDEFIDHARSLDVPDIEVEVLDDARLRFRAPTRFEIGIAYMVDAHGGKIIPSAAPLAQVAVAVAAR